MEHLFRSSSLTLLLAACAALEEGEGEARVLGKVVLEGDVPVARRWDLEQEMRDVAGRDEYVEALWRVADDGGLANCVVTLHPVGGTPLAPPPVPVEDALFEKVGPAYEPRVLVVPEGSTVVLRNRDSPCRGFMTNARRNQGFHMTMSAGMEKRVRFDEAEALRVRCDLREYMRGAIVIVDTPYNAVTDADGRFELAGLAPGAYEVRLWHEALGVVAALEPRILEVVSGRSIEPRYSVRTR